MLTILFLFFKSKTQATEFYNHFTSRHPNIKFTIEHENNNSISILDVFISRRGNKIKTSVFRKPTFSGLGLSYFSFCSNQFKTNAIITMISRAYNICSSYTLLHKEFEFLLIYFFKNGFPKYLFHNYLKKFLDARFKDSSVCFNVPKECIFLSFPYFGHKNYLMKFDIQKILSAYFPQINFKIILANNFKIGSLFRFKDTVPKE